MIRVAIVDDHQMLREGLKKIVEMDQDIDVIGEAADGVDCLNLLANTRPDVVLLDINMPRMDGMATLAVIKDLYPEIRVVMLTIHDEIEYLVEAYQKKADGYVLKDSGSQVLKKAIQVVARGDSYIEPKLLPALKEQLEKGKNRKAIELLTNREFQVLKYLTKGMINKEIASKLGLSEKTVKNHLSNVFKKLGVVDRTQAAVYAIKNHYVDIED